MHLLRIRQAVKRFSASPQVGAASEMVLAVFEPNALVFGSAKDGEADSPSGDALYSSGHMKYCQSRGSGAINALLPDPPGQILFL